MTRRRRATSLPLIAGAVAALAALPATTAEGQNCPVTSSPTTVSNTALESGTVRSGSVYDSTNTNVRLAKNGGTFRVALAGLLHDATYVAAGDFDNDGWDDYAAGAETSAWVRVFRNQTTDVPAPDWSNTALTRAPAFFLARELVAPAASTQRRPLAAADFDGDGWPDLLQAIAVVNEHPYQVRLWVNAAANDHFSYPTFRAPYDAMAAPTTPSQMGVFMWSGRNIVPVDYNGDRKIDLLVGSASDDGTIRIFLNDCTLQNPLPTPLPAADKPLPCANQPHFQFAGSLVSNIGTGAASGALPVFEYVDFDGDGWRDLVVGSPSCCSVAGQRLRIWKGIDGGGLEAASSQSVSFAGGASSVLAADFSLDGKPDLMAATDNNFIGSSAGGSSYYWINGGTATPFTTAFSQQPTTYNNPATDFDGATVFDYDHDPDRTPDALIADSNQSTGFVMLANRTNATYVACGEAYSQPVPLGALATTEMVVTGARLRPTADLSGGTIQYFASNEEPANWVAATACADASGDLCAGFPHSSGRSVRWKAIMCSPGTRTTSPTLSGMQVSFDYTEAREHYRAGVVTLDGVAYVGAFRQPGDRGHFYAINALLDQKYWDVADRLDVVQADSDRRIYTSTVDGKTLLPFRSDAITADVRLTLGATNDAQAATVIDWIRSARFGVGNPGIARSKLGSIETSTPAVMTPPGLPIWYALASPDDRTRVDAFMDAFSDRVKLVFFGAKDGMVHAVRTDPSGNMSDAPSGNEAWAFVPPKVASTMIADYTTSLSGTTSVSSFPDGSPTLTDYRRGDGTLGTALIVGGGNGGQSLSVLDVTSSLTSGPTPLWTATPGDSTAGQGLSKPAVARVFIGGLERFLVIAGTGPALDDLTAPWDKGRVVAAYDLGSGELLWRFQTQCPLTSDITVFETDDELEPSSPQINGYIDRAVFADRCGYVYKVDPARSLAGGWNGNAGLGSIAVDTAGGVAQYALFATGSTSGALGSQSPIAGTIAARPDDSTRMVLFFGTGGMDSHPVNATNEFYGVFADNGGVRNKITGACVSGVCEKFYGGVVVTSNQVILTRTLDPQIGTATCDPGRTTIQAQRLDDVAGSFDTDFNVVVNSAVMGALYGDAGAVYFATLGGAVSRIGTPRATHAGDDSRAPAGTIPTTGTPESGAGGVITGFVDPVTLMGWRQIL